MKIKTRLTIYNIIIIAISLLIMLGIYTFIANSLATNIQNMDYFENSEYTNELVELVNIDISRFIKLSVISIVAVLLVAILFSRIVIKKVMKPVELLSNGAKRIEKGNYNENIEYTNNDEFQIVIKNFNDMQTHLKEETEKNREYKKAKQDMINGISHDIRTPLTAIKGYIKGIQDGVAVSEEKKDEYLRIAYNRTLEIENLINKLFDTFNYEVKKIKLNKKETDIEEFINNFFYSKKYELKDKNIKVKINTLSDKEYIEIDQVQFGRIFENLLNNSIKYSKVENLEIDINIWKENGLLKISYKDNGQGVKEQNLPYLFNEFFKEDQARNNSEENGSGLGLFIVKTIVEAHNGSIIAKNSNGLYFEIAMKGEKNEQNIDC